MEPNNIPAVADCDPKDMNLLSSKKDGTQKQPKLNLIRLNQVKAEKVQWLWYPYIPFGKITIVQGDPGEGKTYFVLALISALTRGEPLPECSEAAPPMDVIYQTAEDGLTDTIKPRLEATKADCSRVIFIDEGKKSLTIMDERLECAVRETGARLVVLDPLQAFLGSRMDMNRPNEVRPIMKHISDMAQRTSCAVILIGHMNKAQGIKSSYRGLGSIDFRAAARSVLIVGQVSEDSEVRAIVQDKNSLAPKAPSISFSLDHDNRFRWLGLCDVSASELLNGTGSSMSKVETMEEELKRLLVECVPASYVFAYAKNLGIGERTVKEAKEHLGVISEKKGGKWYWRLPDASIFHNGT